MLCCCADSENLCQLTNRITKIIVASLERKLSLKLSNESIYGSTVLLHILLAILTMALHYRRYTLHYNSFVSRQVSGGPREEQKGGRRGRRWKEMRWAWGWEGIPVSKPRQPELHCIPLPRNRKEKEKVTTCANMQTPLTLSLFMGAPSADTFNSSTLKQPKHKS